MLALAPYIAPLSFDVPPPILQRNMLDKLSARQIENTLKRQEKKQQYSQEKTKKKDEKKLNKARERSESEVLELQERLQEMESKIEEINLKADEKLLAKSNPKLAKIEEKRSKRIEKTERKRNELSNELSDQRPQPAGRPGKSKDGKIAAKMEYIVVEAL